MANPPISNPGAKELTSLTGDERLTVLGPGGIEQVVSLSTIAAFIGGGGVVTSVPNGGTGLASLTLNGVLYGNGTNPVGVTAAAAEGNVLVAGPSGVPQWTTGPGTVNQVLTSHGPGTIPTFVNAQGGTYPPPAPDFATTLAADAAAGRFTDWIYGDVTLAAPLTINLTASVNNIGLDMHGANLICGFTDPTSSMITYFCPDSNVNVNVEGLSFRNFYLFGSSNCLHGIVLSARLGSASGIFNGNFINVKFVGCSIGSGCRLYGNVFEYDYVTCSARDNLIGVEMRNPTAGGGVGVVSSIKFTGGDYRANLNYGIASTADTAFQEAVGFHVIASDFIGNAFPGIYGGSGIALVFATHLERNCTSGSTPSRAAIYTAGGPACIVQCDSADNSGRTLYVMDIGGANVNQLTTSWLNSANDEGTGFGMKVGLLRGAGTLVLDFQNASGGIAANFDGDGAWITQAAAYVQGTI